MIYFLMSYQISSLFHYGFDTLTIVTRDVFKTSLTNQEIIEENL